MFHVYIFSDFCVPARIVSDFCVFLRVFVFHVYIFCSVGFSALYVLSDYPPQLFLVARCRNTPAVRRHCLNCANILTEKEHGATQSPDSTARICQRTCRPTGGATTKSAHSTSLSEGRFNQSPSSSSRASGKAQAGAAFAHSSNGTSMSESDSTSSMSIPPPFTNNWY